MRERAFLTAVVAANLVAAAAFSSLPYEPRPQTLQAVDLAASSPLPLPYSCCEAEHFAPGTKFKLSREAVALMSQSDEAR